MLHSEPTSVQGFHQQPVEAPAPLQFRIDLVRGNQPFLGESSEASYRTSLLIISSPVYSAPGLSKALSPEMGPKGKVLSRSVSTSDLTMDTSSGLQRKRHFVDGEGFIHPPKSKTTAKVGKSSDIQNRISTYNTYESLASETAVEGPSGVSGNFQTFSDPRSRKMLPIVAKFIRADTTVVNGIKAQTSELISFEYAASGLEIRTSDAADHQSVARYIDGWGTKLYTVNPNPGEMMKFILRGSPTHHRG